MPWIIYIQFYLLYIISIYLFVCFIVCGIFHNRVYAPFALCVNAFHAVCLFCLDRKWPSIMVRLFCILFNLFFYLFICSICYESAARLLWNFFFHGYNGGRGGLSGARFFWFVCFLVWWRWRWWLGERAGCGETGNMGIGMVARCSLSRSFPERYLHQHSLRDAGPIAKLFEYLLP